MLPQQTQEKKFTLFDQVLKEIRPVLTIVFGFSFVVNLLNLLTPLYSLQVLDRVLGTQSKETLFFLSLISGLAPLINKNLINLVDLRESTLFTAK